MKNSFHAVIYLMLALTDLQAQALQPTSCSLMYLLHPGSVTAADVETAHAKTWQCKPSTAYSS
jgi:hypothetical protein